MKNRFKTLAIVFGCSLCTAMLVGGLTALADSKCCVLQSMAQEELLVGTQRTYSTALPADSGTHYWGTNLFV